MERAQLHGMWASVAPAWGEHADYADTRGAAITAKLLELSAPQPGERVLELDPPGPAARRPGRARGLGPAGPQPLARPGVRRGQRQLGAPPPPPGIPGPFSLDDPDRLARLLAAADFADVVVTEVPTPLRDPSVDAWWTRTSALAGPLAKRLAAMPETARRQLLVRLTEAARPYQTAAGLDFPGVSLVAAARRS